MATTEKLPVDLPPSYPSHEPAPSARSSSSLPAYEEPAQPASTPYLTTVPTPFTPTQTLRIEAQGHAAISLPTSPKPDPIPVYDLAAGPDPLYVSLRAQRSSGTCTLVKGTEDICTTTYRFGPGRPPVITLHGSDEAVVMESAGAFTRAQLLRSSHGTFRLRYASSSERKAQEQNSVLIIERITTASSPNTSKTEELATEMGRFVRGEGTRTPGTSKHTAGNGGLLLLDLEEWRGEKSRGEEEGVRGLVVAGVVAMLKKEVDRRRGLQMAVIAGAASGGGP